MDIPLLILFTLLQCKVVCPGKFRSSAKLTTVTLRPLCALVATLSPLSRQHYFLYVRTSCSSSHSFCMKSEPTQTGFWIRMVQRRVVLKEFREKLWIVLQDFLKKLCMIMDRPMQPRDRGDGRQCPLRCHWRCMWQQHRVSQKTAVKPWFSSVYVSEECS